MPPTSTRATRQSSRMSSPFVTTTRNSPAPSAVEPSKDKKQSTLHEWVEPPLAPPRPSFEEAGFDRAGLFVDMQPLGSVPSSKLKAKIRDSHGRRTAGGELSGLSALGEEGTSMETTPAAEAPPRSESRKPEDIAPPPVEPPREEEKEVEHRPAEVKKEQRIRLRFANGAASASSTPPPRASPIHTRQPSTTSTPLPAAPFQPSASPPRTLQPSPFFNPPVIAAPPATPPKMTAPAPAPPPVLDMTLKVPWNRDAAEQVINVVRQINDDSGKLTNLAVMQVVRLAHKDPTLWDALRAVGSQQATPEQLRRFRNYVKREKNRLKKRQAEMRASSSHQFLIPDLSGVPAYSPIVSQPPLSSTPALTNPATHFAPSTNDAFWSTTNISAPIQGFLPFPQPRVQPPIQELSPQIVVDPSLSTQPKSLESSPTYSSGSADTIPGSFRASPVNRPLSELPRRNLQEALAESPSTPGSASADSFPISPVAPPTTKTPPCRSTQDGVKVEGEAEVAAEAETETEINGMASPAKRQSQSEDELSEVDEAVIRRHEAEEVAAEVLFDESDGPAKRQRTENGKRVVKLKASHRRKKGRDREQAQLDLEQERELDAKRLKARQNYEATRPEVHYTDEDSQMRTLPTPPVLTPPQPPAESSAANTRSRRQLPQQPTGPIELQLNGTRKRAADELDDSGSSLTESLPSSALPSGPGTPQFHASGPPQKKQKRAAKTKIS